METIESFIKGKMKDPALCEDGIFVSDEFVMVIDGATTSRGCSFAGKRPGRFAMETICETLEELVHPEVSSPEELLTHLSKMIRARAHDENLEVSDPELPRASVIAYDRTRGEIWSYGDCQCIVNGIWQHHEKEVDRRNSEKRARVLEEAFAAGGSLEEFLVQDPGRVAILEDLEAQHTYENLPGPLGYPVLNGSAIRTEMILRFPVPEGSEVILATDGYPELHSTLEESEEALARLLSEDPLCFRLYKTTKGKMNGMESFDDRAYWRGR